MENWYTLYTKPNAEALVARTLIARGLTVLLPLLPSRPGERLRPLFPAYLFVRCDLTVIGIENLQWIPGLRRILSFERPACGGAGRGYRADRARSGRDRGRGRAAPALFQAGRRGGDRPGAAGRAARHLPGADRARPSASASWCASWARPTAPRCLWRRCAAPAKKAWARTGAAAPAGTAGRSITRADRGDRSTGRAGELATNS